MEAKALTDAIAKLQSARWHIVHNTVNEGLVDGLVHDAVNLLEPRMHSERLAYIEKLNREEELSRGDVQALIDELKRVPTSTPL